MHSYLDFVDDTGLFLFIVRTHNDEQRAMVHKSWTDRRKRPRLFHHQPTIGITLAAGAGVETNSQPAMTWLGVLRGMKSYPSLCEIVCLSPTMTRRHSNEIETSELRRRRRRHGSTEPRLHSSSITRRWHRSERSVHPSCPV